MHRMRHDLVEGILSDFTDVRKIARSWDEQFSGGSISASRVESMIFEAPMTRSLVFVFLVSKAKGGKYCHATL